MVLFDRKPHSFSPAHKNPNFCELVCSNSLKSNDSLVASGLLKRELEAFDSIVLACANECKVAAGGALAVDRDKFAKLVTQKIKEFENITIKNLVVEDIPDGFDYVIVATGPLTDGKLLKKLREIVDCDNLSFFDASSPIVSYKSVDKKISFVADRYGKGNGDYINCPMNKEEYELFYEELINAKTVELHSFEKKEVFESCMPIEIMAKRGKDSIRFGPLKPIGLTNPDGTKPYAVVQLRKEDEKGINYNLVGFQTNLTFGEQKRVFSLIPALKNAEFLRYGVMHRNSFVNAPVVLEKTFQLKKKPNIFIAGQLSGVEGYVESIMGGLICALNCYLLLNKKTPLNLSAKTMIGAIINYITSGYSKNFQPMNANFGIIEPLDQQVRDEKLRKQMYYDRSMEEINKLVKMVDCEE